MESKRTYRDAAGREIKLPKEVYYRCLWTVRDERRLRELAGLMRRDDGSNMDEHPADNRAGTAQEGGTDQKAVIVSDDVVQRAAAEIACIRRALAKVPEVYREELLDNIVDKEPLPDFAHANTWKRWKLVFLYELAKELRLI